MSHTRSDPLVTLEWASLLQPHTPQGTQTFVIADSKPLPTTPTDIKFGTPILISYSLLLSFTLIYLGVSGYTTQWSSSLFLGAAAGFSSTSFTIIMLISWRVFCRQRAQAQSIPLAGIHANSSPPSCSIGALIIAPIITLLWTAAIAILAATHIVSSQDPRWEQVMRDYDLHQGLLYAELALTVISLVSSIVVMVLQVLQKRHYLKQGLTESLWRN